MTSALQDCWRLRDAFISLLWRDLKERYRNTYVGAVWAILNPFVYLVVLSLIFSKVLRFELPDYALYLFSGLLPWVFFQTSLAASVRAFRENKTLIDHIYTPLAFFPLLRVSVRFFDFAAALIAMGTIALLVELPLKPQGVMILAACFPLFLFTLGAAYLSATLTVFIRDGEFIIPLFVQLAYFVTPVLYPMSFLPDAYREILILNPVYSQIRLFHELLYFGRFPTVSMWLTAFSIASLTLICGWVVLQQTQRKIFAKL